MHTSGLVTTSLEALAEVKSLKLGKFMREMSYGKFSSDIPNFHSRSEKFLNRDIKRKILHFINRNKLHVNSKNVVSCYLSRSLSLLKTNFK